MSRVLIFVIVAIPVFSITTTIATALTERKHNQFIKPDAVVIEKSVAMAGDRARHVLYIIDELYKLYITLTAEKYARDIQTFSSVAITQEVFKKMESRGWHNARFLSLSDHPLNPDSTPRDNFERDAINIITSGAKNYERFYFDIKGKDFLRAVTGVYLTSEKCTICHSDRKIGDLIGAISYIFPLEKYMQ